MRRLYNDLEGQIKMLEMEENSMILTEDPRNKDPQHTT